MESTTATFVTVAKESGPVAFDIGGLAACLARLKDRRHKRGTRYQLVHVLVMIVLAKLSGEDRPAGIADWLCFRREHLIRMLGLERQTVPHRNTVDRILAEVVDPDEFDMTVKEYFAKLATVGESVLIAFDGKTLRGTISPDNPRGEHLLAAYLPEEGIVLVQMAAGDKENEITVAPKLLSGIDLRGKVVAADAMHTQRELSIQIVAAGGDYLWIAKDNQPTLRSDIEELFAADDLTVLGGHVEKDFETYKMVEKGHGRIETRKITVSSELKAHLDWPGLEQVFKIERDRLIVTTGKLEHETVYGLTSQSRTKAGPKRLLTQNRAYWGIENGLHGTRDTTFDEDGCRLTRGNAGRVMATLNSLVINLLRLAGQTNLAQARRRYNADPQQALTLILASLR